jgi:hypothetical protein
LDVNDKAKVKIGELTAFCDRSFLYCRPAGHPCAWPERIDRHQRWEAAVPSRTYEIIVRGRLSPGLVAACEGFEAAEFDQGMTHLVGLVPDQKVLHRLLRVLRDLNVELVSVNPVTEETISSTTTS